MKSRFFVACMMSLAIGSPAVAQTAPDDPHCFFLSNFYAKAEKDEKLRALAGQAAMFYLGKIDGRVNLPAFKAAIPTRLDPKIAGPQMMACAQQVGRAEVALQKTLQSLAPRH